MEDISMEKKQSKLTRCCMKTGKGIGEEDEETLEIELFVIGRTETLGLGRPENSAAWISKSVIIKSEELLEGK
jgi:hypothetical protein